MVAASYHPRILSLKYGQTGNVKPLIVQRSLSFAVKWQHLDLKVSYNSLPNQEIIRIQNDTRSWECKPRREKKDSNSKMVPT